MGQMVRREVCKEWLSMHPILAVERPEWHVLPALDVTCAPVIHQHHTKDVFLGGVHADGLADAVSRPHQTRLQRSLKRRWECARNFEHGTMVRYWGGDRVTQADLLRVI